MSTRALQGIRVKLDRLFDRFDRLPPGFAKDLADGARAADKPRIPEINLTTRLSPGLLCSEAVTVCTSMGTRGSSPIPRGSDHATES